MVPADHRLRSAWHAARSRPATMLPRHVGGRTASAMALFPK
jgi:hypothetical protein